MKILFAGGGTGGHFYPIIAIVEALNELADREHIVDLKLYFMSDNPINAELLKKAHIAYIEVQTGKRRTYFSIKNYIDIFKTLGGVIYATFKIFVLYPDVIFGKGGYASFPAMFAARILRIPVVIHESDIIPGKVNRWIGDYATNIAISYPEATKYFKHKDRIALTGQPVRKIVMEIPSEDPFDVLQLEPGIPVILVLGGSQGAERINENLIDIMPQLITRYQVIHQTGENNYDWMKKRATGVLTGNPNIGRYRPIAFLESKQLRVAAKSATLIISRAGSTIFEISLWQKPSILIPLAIARDDHQRENAYSYARTGSAVIIEEQNLKPGVFFSVIESVMEDKSRREKMIEGTKEFAKRDASEKIAQLLLSICTKHG